MKVVFDTSIYISFAITKEGKAEEAYFWAIDSDMQIYTSIPIITEIANKLKGKFSYTYDEVESIIRHICGAANIVNPSCKVKILQDDPDNRILECAKETKADIIVTGDNHLLKLKEFEDIKIFTLADFLKTYKYA